jgi:hypothetical protein
LLGRDQRKVVVRIRILSIASQGFLIQGGRFIQRARPVKADTLLDLTAHG